MKYTEFLGEKVNFISSDEVIKGVICDVYEFVGNKEKDLGIIKIKKGFSSPKQKILKGDKTINSVLLGKGNFILNGKKYSCDGINKDLFEVNVGDIMQWEAKTDLKYYEICYPPYEDGRFKNL